MIINCMLLAFHDHLGIFNFTWDFGIENLWNILFQKFDMFLWTSVFQNPLVHTDFDMFVDE